MILCCIWEGRSIVINFKLYTEVKMTFLETKLSINVNQFMQITAQGGVDARLLENFASLIVNEDKDFMANDPFLSGRAALGDQGDSVKDYSDILGVLRVDEEEIMNGKEAISSPQNMSVLVRSKAKRLVALRIMELLNGPNVSVSLCSHPFPPPAWSICCQNWQIFVTFACICKRPGFTQNSPNLWSSWV